MGKSTQKPVAQNDSNKFKSDLISEQLDILENNFKFYHAWTPNSFEGYDDGYIGSGTSSSNVGAPDILARSIVVSDFPSNAMNELNEQTVSEFFSAFGSVVNVKISSDGQAERICLITFENGSDGVQNALKSQPIRMFGSILTVELAERDLIFQINNTTDLQKDKVPPFSLIISPPCAGPWYRKPPENTSYLKSSTLSSPPKALGTVQKIAAAASTMIKNNFNPQPTETSSDMIIPTPENLQKQRKQLQRMPSSSLHSLLSPTTRNSLFDDGADHASTDNLQSPPEMGGAECFYCDHTLLSWVWASSCSATEISIAERHLSNTLILGRSISSSLPLLAILSSPYVRKCNGEKGYLLENSDVHTLHKRTDVAVTNNLNDKQTGCYTLYQSRHPCLAPLISVTTCSNSELGSNGKESIMTVFDITPSRHKSLHELLRTEDFLTKPLYPGCKGHSREAELKSRAGACQSYNLATNPIIAWFNKSANGDEEDLCKCRTIFDRGKESESNVFQPDRNFRAELGQYRSSTSTMFSLLAEQEIFDDLKKLHLLPQTSSKHPQIYTRLNQTRALRRVGTSYHADVADLRIKFLAFQMFHAVSFLHSKGVTLGDQLRPDRIFIEKDGWLRLVVPVVQGNICDCEAKMTKDCIDKKDGPNMSIGQSFMDSIHERRVIFNRYEGDSKLRGGSPTPEATIIPYPGYGLLPFIQWQRGQITNLAYLMMINAAAGRTVGDEMNPPILPWVTDFTSEIDHNSEWRSGENVLASPWRDLTKTKYRLHKGDEQLDHSYMYSSPAHHVPETISDLTYTVYRARTIPLSELQARVRNQFIPEHYPGSVERLYIWTPDEATPEFYIPSHPCIFTSKHKEMNDMLLPPWCNNDPSVFVSYHRSLLESEQVSQFLHSWIDLLFGIALSGERAVLEKNAVLHSKKWNAVNNLSNSVQCHGGCYPSIVKKRRVDVLISDPTPRPAFVQLFIKPHPKRTLNIYQNITPPGEYYSNCEDNSNNLVARKQHDLSMIGAILQECYASAQVIPDDSTQAAIDRLLEGQLDIKSSLQHSESGDATVRKGTFIFPACLQQVYDCLSEAQTTTFARNPCETSADDSDLTSRSTELEKSWKMIRNINLFTSLSNATYGVLLPALFTPLLSSQHFMENYQISRPYTSFADKMGRYIINLSRSIPGGMATPLALQLFVSILNQSYYDSAIAEATGKLVLDEGIASTLYRHSTWHEYVRHISSFVTSQLISSSADVKQPTYLYMNSIVVYFITFLARDNALGASICCRYLVPLLISHVEKCSAGSNQNMSVQVLRSLVPLLPSEAVGITIIRPILKFLWQKLSHRVASGQEDSADHTNNPVDAISNFPPDLLRDLVSLLHVCLRKIETHAATYFFQSTPMCIPQLLFYSFKAVVSHQTSDTINEDKSISLDIFSDSCLLLKSMISNANTDDKYSQETLLPTIEALSSEVNDEYLSIKMKKESKFQGEDEQNRVLLLPGIADVCMVAKEAMRAFDPSIFNHKCPSAMELLAWIETPWNIKIQQKNDVASKRERNKALITEVEYDEDPQDDVSQLFSSQIVGDNAIEMLAPKHSNILDDASDESGEEDNTLGTDAKRTIIVDEKGPTTMSSAVQFSFKMEQYEYLLNRQKRDLAWLIGVHRRPDQDQIKYMWQPRMMATTSLVPSGSVGSDNCEQQIITSMATNTSESLLVAGNNIGEILLFDLRRYPPSMVYRRHVVSNAEENDMTDPKTIRQISFIGTSDDVLVCDGGLHLWDIESGSIKSSISSRNASLCGHVQGSSSWKVEKLLGYSLFPSVTSSNEIIHSSCGEVAAISSSNLYMIDMRCRIPPSSHHVTNQFSASSSKQVDPMVRHLTWCTSMQLEFDLPHHFRKSPQLPSQVSSFNLNCVASHSDWVCTGSSSGHIHCFDRRQSKLLMCWKAHTRSIEYLQAVSSHLLLSVSAEKIAVVWNLAQNPPELISSIYNIPGKEGTMNITSHYFEEDGIVSIPGQGNLLLCAATGRKAVFQSMLTENSPGQDPTDAKADRIVMCDYDGAHIASSRKFNIHSIALLPLRQLVLLGCEDEIHVCL